MKNCSNYIILTWSLATYFLLWYLLQPILGYMLDSDSVAYLTIAKRVAEGQYFESINGLWSPLNSWILVPFIRHGYDAFLVAKWINMVCGAILLIQSFYLFQHVQFKKMALLCSMFSLSIVITFFAYFQLFGDVMQMIFMMFYLRIILKGNFFQHYGYAILSGLIMGIAFYAKAYSFVFFGIHFLVVLGYYLRKKQITIKRAIINYILGIGTAIIIVLPWSLALHQKYNEWSITGFAGKLNMSWYINSGKTFKSSIQLLIPPTYKDSPSFWEDPYLSQGELSKPTSSVTHFIKWIARVIHTTLIAITCFIEISFLSIAILLIALFYLFFKKDKEVFDEKLEIIICTIILLPIGYLMMHIETRYIWFNTFMLMILGVKLIDHKIAYQFHRYTYSLIIVICCLSFITFPLTQIENLKYKNKHLFDIAKEVKKQNIRGRFTSNISDAGQMWVVAYLTGNQFYTIEKTQYSFQELKDEINRYQVDYYFLQTENNQSVLRIDDSLFIPYGKIQDITVFKIRH